MYQKKSDDELIQLIYDVASNDARSKGPGEGAKAELNRRLINSIGKLNKTTTHYSRWLIGLTFALGFLVIVQIIIAITVRL